MRALPTSANGRLTSRRQILAGLALALSLALMPKTAAAVGAYSWREDNVGDRDPPRTLESTVAPPPGFARVSAPSGSFAAWLRGLPMKPEGAKVMLYSGAEKARQDVHSGVIDIDVGTRDLQQCADAVMRLHAEWLFAAARQGDIAFTVTEGGRVPFSRWAKGERPAPSGKSWKAFATRDASYQNFRKYMNFIYSYAGTASLEKELQSVELQRPRDRRRLHQGRLSGARRARRGCRDQFATTSAKRFLLIQSYMPAQDMHVLKNMANGDGSPWYAVPTGELVTPEWTFAAGSLKRWP